MKIFSGRKSVGNSKRPHLFRGINFTLGILILIMINLVGSNSFFKIDLTSNNAYSLSQVSKETLALLEDPLRVKVFYAEKLPAPYNGVRRYLVDLLKEYEGSRRDVFSYEIIETTSPEGKSEASRYGLSQVEIQEVKSDEFQSRAVYMGLAVLYGNTVERVDRINTTSGLEYRLTTAIRSAMGQSDALSGTEAKVAMKVIASPALSQINIQGFSELEQEMIDVYHRINEDNYGRISFEFLEPSSRAEIDQLSSRYGLEPLSWKNENGETRRGLLEVVLTLEDRTERMPLRILSSLFGAYSLEQPETIEETIRQGLKSLVSVNPRIAYAVGNGEKNLDDSRQGAAAFSQLLDERFEIVSVNPAEKEIPSDIDTMIINGPSGPYSEAALYRIDQFVMNGGNLFVLLDRHVQNIPTQQQMMAGARPSWEKTTTGLEKLLKSWGAEVSENIVLDEESYISRGQNGQQQLFQVPVLSGDSINRDSVVTAGLEDIILLNAGRILPSAETDGENTPTYTVLLQSSPKAWTVAGPMEITPHIQGAPGTTETERQDIAVLLEGTFESNFDEPVDLPLLPSQRNAESEALSERENETGNKHEGGTDTAADNFIGDRFRKDSVEDSRIIVVGTSALTTAQLLDPQSRTPNGTFLLNAVDYLNGAPGFAELRSKGLGVPRLHSPSPSSRLIARWANTILVPLLVLFVGLIVWLQRRNKARRIKSLFQDNQEV
jgi:ABC-2 type transport system permease protein